MRKSRFSGTEIVYTAQQVEMGVPAEEIVNRTDQACQENGSRSSEECCEVVSGDQPKEAPHTGRQGKPSTTTTPPVSGIPP